MQKVTTKTALAAMLAAALVIPASAFAEVTHRAKNGVMVCSGTENPNHAYYFSNNNTRVRGKLRITEIEITDNKGITEYIWSPGDMPTGLPSNGILKPLFNKAVEASDMAENNMTTNYPMQVRVSWETTSGRVATQPSIALVRNFRDGSGNLLSQRASGCRPIFPND